MVNLVYDILLNELKINDTKCTAWPISGPASESLALREWRYSPDGCAETSESLRWLRTALTTQAGREHYRMVRNQNGLVVVLIKQLTQ